MSLQADEFDPESSETEATPHQPEVERHQSPTQPLPNDNALPAPERETLPVGRRPALLEVEEFTPESSSASLRARPPSLDHRVSRVTHSITPPLNPGPRRAGALGVEGYLVSDELGRGAQGIVYRATPDDGGRDVAIKILRPEASDEQLERFDEAIDTMEGLRGVKGVVQLIARGSTSLGAPYFAMDLVRGPSLRSVLNRGRLSPRQLVKLLVDVAYAAHRAHDRGVVHRDLKPENILIEEGSSGMVPHVADFGLARDLAQGTPHSTAGGLGGTPAYTAPEQVLGMPVSRRTDVHALGSILYELISGSPPFQSANVATTIHAVATQVPRRPAARWTGLPKPLEDIALRALAKDPNDRYPTAATFAQQIQSALEGSAVGSVPTRKLQRPGRLRKKFVRGVRRRSLFLKGLALGLAVGAALGVLAGSLVG